MIHKPPQTTRKPNCVTKARKGNTVLTVSGFFTQGATGNAADKMMKLLPAESSMEQIEDKAGRL